MASDSLSEALDAVEAALDAAGSPETDASDGAFGLAASIKAFNAAAKEALR